MSPWLGIDGHVIMIAGDETDPSSTSYNYNSTSTLYTGTIMAPPPLVLSPTPPLSPLLASDVETIYLAAALQLGCPGQWGVSEPSLAGPSISHRETRIPPSHLSSLPMYRGPEEDLSPEEKADSTAWTAYIDENFTDLVVRYHPYHKRTAALS